MLCCRQNIQEAIDLLNNNTAPATDFVAQYWNIQEAIDVVNNIIYFIKNMMPCFLVFTLLFPPLVGFYSS